MSLFWNRKKQAENTALKSPVAMQEQPIRDAIEPLDFTVPLEQGEEYDTVAIISSAIVSTHITNATVRIKSIREVDRDKEAAAIICAAVLAHDKPNSTFRLKAIREETKNA